MIDTVAGVDTAYRQGNACAAVVVFRFKDLKIMEETVAIQPVRFPYVPGLLSFREGPVILEALSRLKKAPDALMFDGQGIAHPRRFGLASHIGLLADIPAIGCAKTRLVGDYQEPQQTRGSTADLVDGGETVGAVVRTRTGVKPLYVSIGHLMDLNTGDRHRKFVSGMVFTCEPGIYIRDEAIGIRIENDILISSKGPVDLTRTIPREADEIEDLMNR